jgi:SNF2 family DNA or RNA helicase
VANEAPTEIQVDYDEVRTTGRLTRSDSGSSPIWERLRAHLSADAQVRLGTEALEMPWPKILEIVREFGSGATQQALNFRFRPTPTAAPKIAAFVREYKEARAKRDTLTLLLSPEDIERRLVEAGFTRRKLKPFQLRDLAHLLSLSHGANFSVPGAGKTTVAFALHLLGAKGGAHLLIICPKAAFPAWRLIVQECMSPDAPGGGAEEFTILDGSQAQTDELLRSGRKRFVMSYDLMVRQQPVIAQYLARNPVHLILDESHRMKAGLASQRGAFLLAVADRPARRDILSGTPMPQDPSDLASQLGFLWPGTGYDLQIERGSPPRTVLGQLYVRTTKEELGLPKANRYFHSVSMREGQLALYSIVRNEALRQISKTINSNALPDVVKARRSVMRLLQLSSNPTLALQAMVTENPGLGSGIVDQVLAEGISSKMAAVMDHARALARDGKKSVIWTIFTGNIHDLEVRLADLNPVSLYGAVPSGEFTEPNSREGRLRRFHLDDSCQVMIANPAAAGEGISLHEVCHNAIYLDRSYVSTHYLQSIDRIHRLGLKPGTETNIHIYRTKAPREIGSVDLSVSRRLSAKIHGLQQLLNDHDLLRIAMDEDEAGDPIELDVEMQDLIDLVAELENRASREPEEE